jgi:hypothetical protein
VAWTAPRTWASGELVTAALMNEQLRDNALALEAGRLSITSQAVGDFFIASSSTDMGREPASAIFPLVSPLTTRGDLLVASSGTVTGARLAVGSAGTLMASDGTDAAWTTVTGTVLQKTAAYTATTGDCGTDCTIKCSMTSGGAAFTIGLYAASGNSGRRLTVIKETNDVHIVTVDGNASETINGLADFKLYAKGDFVSLVCDGSGWWIDSERQTIQAHSTLSSAQTILTGTVTLVEYDTSAYDTAGMWTGSSTHKFTVPRAGFYQISAGAGLDEPGDSACSTYIYKNGAVERRFIDKGVLTSNLAISSTIKLAKDDYVQVYTEHGKGSSTTVHGIASLSYFSIAFLGT